jgi:putative nucleotidyltransferase with HDIG domain
MVERYLHIPLASLMADTLPDFDLFLIKPGYAGRYVLYRREGLYLTPEHLVRLKAHHVDTVYIRASDQARQQRYMVDTARRLVSDTKRSTAERAEMIYEFCKSSVQCALEEPCEENIRVCRDLALEHVRFVVSDPQAVPNLLRIISYDYYTYTHSVNVCSFTVALCQRAGLNDDAQLGEIGIGAMLHDIGKSRIPKSILNKPGKLTPAEREQIMKHPELGVAVLAETSPISPQAADIVLAHHEKCDGSGYPAGRAGDQLPLAVRACCIADIFDALTTNRSYKSAYAGFRALKIMQQEMRGQLDEAILTDLIRLVGQAPAAGSAGGTFATRPEAAAAETYTPR